MIPPDDAEPPSPLFEQSLPPRTGPVARLRPARFAGTLYPADPLEIRRTVQRLLGVSPPDSFRPRRPLPRALGLVLPHGPWSHVGKLVADGAKRGLVEETVVLLAPNHAGRGPRSAIVCDGGYVLPGGTTVPIEGPLAESIRGLGGLTEAPEVFTDEHAIEVLLPFLVAVQSRLAIVPIAIHDLVPQMAARIGAAIADAIVGRGGGATIVATTDLAHYVPRASLAAATDDLVEKTVALDDEGLVSVFRGRTSEHTPGPVIETCGLGALLTFVHAMRALGASRGEIVGRASTADLEGERGAAVAYGTFAFLR